MHDIISARAHIISKLTMRKAAVDGDDVDPRELARDEKGYRKTDEIMAKMSPIIKELVDDFKKSPTGYGSDEQLRRNVLGMVEVELRKYIHDPLYDK